MPRCADHRCGRWRPDLRSLERVAGAFVRRLSALQFNGLSYCSRSCVERAARAGLGEPAASAVSSSRLPPLKLGVLLRHAGAITEIQLETALAMCQRTGLKIGEQLLQLGYTTSDHILRALAAQGGVSYLSTFDVSRVERVQVGLPAAMVRALGLVPFEADEELRRLSVVCAAPVPKAATRALMRLTGWTAELYLVSDRVFEAALDAYAPAVDTVAVHEAVTLESLGSAASHIADLATRERAITMTQAECNQYRWVRVRGPVQTRDLFVTSTRKETPCQAELTAH